MAFSDAARRLAAKLGSDVHDVTKDLPAEDLETMAEIAADTVTFEVARRFGAGEESLPVEVDEFPPNEHPWPVDGESDFIESPASDNPNKDSGRETLSGPLSPDPLLHPSRNPRIPHFDADDMASSADPARDEPTEFGRARRPL
jgi:hypothetical protein